MRKLRLREGLSPGWAVPATDEGPFSWFPFQINPTAGGPSISPSTFTVAWGPGMTSPRHPTGPCRLGGSGPAGLSSISDYTLTLGRFHLTAEPGVPS